MRFNGSWFVTVFVFIPGACLALLSSYYLFTGLYHLIEWNSTTGTITGVVVKESIDDFAYHEKAVFIDTTGKTIEVIALSGVDEREDARDGEVSILFNPKNTSQAIILLWRDYLILLFFPFAALLMILGWPFERKSVTATSYVN
jgi:hypothetical protein